MRARVTRTAEERTIVVVAIVEDPTGRQVICESRQRSQLAQGKAHGSQNLPREV